MSTKRFFTPFVGRNYKKGINGKTCIPDNYLTS